MTLDRLKTLVLARLDELSLNGADIPRDSPHISDYMRKMPGFIDGQLRVIGSIIPKRKYFSIFHNPPVDRSVLGGGDGGPIYQSIVSYPMPADFHSVVKVTRADGYSAAPHISWLNDKTLAIYYTATGEYVVEYRAVPGRVDDATPGEAEIDVDAAAVPALVAGVAAMCIQHENEAVFSQLYRENQGLLANLRPAPRPISPQILNKLF